MHVQANAFQLLLNLAPHDSVRCIHPEREPSDQASAKEERDPTSSKGGKDPNSDEGGVDRESVLAERRGDVGQVVAGDRRGELLEENVGGLNGRRRRVTRAASREVLVASGEVRGRTADGRLGGIESFGRDDLKLLELCRPVRVSWTPGLTSAKTHRQVLRL